jgi:YbbR domain-containing protein
MKIKHLFFNNFGLKITALLFALTVWILIAGQEHAYLEKNFEANVEFFNTSENIDANPRPEKVRIKVKGTSREIKNISADDFKIKIDLAGISQGTTLNLLAGDFLELPGNIDPEEVTIHPRMIAVTVKQLIWKEVAVKVNFTGKPARGIVLTKKIVPGKVRIYGYKSQITAINTVIVEQSVDLSEINKSKTLKLYLQKREEILRVEGSEEIEIQLVVEETHKNETDKKK